VWRVGVVCVAMGVRMEKMSKTHTVKKRRSDRSSSYVRDGFSESLDIQRLSLIDIVKELGLDLFAARHGGVFFFDLFPEKM
jgi:hypothetical protein